MKLKTSKSVLVPGFKVSGLACGIKPSGHKDLSLIVSDAPAVCAGVFTVNQVRAPSVTLAERSIENNPTHRAVIVNSGNANACNGPQGLEDCLAVLENTGKALDCDASEVLMASTGVIGVPLPVNKIQKGLPFLVGTLSPKHWEHAAEGILTTDLVTKKKSVEYASGGHRIHVGGIAKGSGMISPDMATMLAFLVTNANIGKSDLRHALKLAVDSTFNRITVDGECSTNDMVLIMANKKAGNPTIKKGSKDFEEFVEALTEVCKDLAFKIVVDGEGATKFVTIAVQGGRSQDHANAVGRSVAESLLVKTALFGEDPNWGRIICAIGNSGVEIKAQLVDIFINQLQIVGQGGPLNGVSLAKLRKKMKSKEIEILIDLNLGKAESKTYTCDLSYDYVKINAEYTT